jgi:hypothetical protein
MKIAIWHRMDHLTDFIFAPVSAPRCQTHATELLPGYFSSRSSDILVISMCLKARSVVCPGDLDTFRVSAHILLLLLLGSVFFCGPCPWTRMLVLC